jgi:hypothetical protein
MPMRLLACATITILALTTFAEAASPIQPSEKMAISERATNDAFGLFANGQVAPIVIGADDIQPGAIAAHLLASDLDRVTGKNPAILDKLSAAKGNAVIMGTLGHSKVIDAVVAATGLDVSPIRGQWETYLIAVVDHPTKDIPHALVIIGSDRRGTAYGALTLSRAIGVSPWYWWADAPVQHRDAIYIASGRYSDGAPKVKYRGIFLNDEAPALTGWAKEKFGGLNSKAYEHIFELLLRLKANYLWPAMWGNAFNEDDPLSPKLANDYGIVMGTSHQEPMLRAQAEFDHRFAAKDWNYATSPDLLRKFWREGIARNKNYDSIITMGLRGRNDSEMIKGATIAQSSALLETIVADQRKILAEEMNPDVTKVPQLWALYKEVQEYYEHGLRVPDDITLLWADDNWGDLRRVPTEAERKRSGGSGIYYHFDYVGGPRNYKWINTNPTGKIWEQMNIAYAYGADRIWIVNVGDLKPMELPIDFFLTMAWNPTAMTAAKERDYSRSWAAEIFGSSHASEIANLYDWYTGMNGRRKPELLNTSPEGIYSLTNYGEADKVLAECAEATAKAENLGKSLTKEQQDAYFQLILHPVKATAIVNQLQIEAGKNHLYAEQGRTAANDAGDKVKFLFKADADLTQAYHQIAAGKWNHMMDQTHIGYTTWRDPATNIMPALASVTPLSAPAMGLAIDGKVADKTAKLASFDSISQQQRTIEVFNRGTGVLAWTAKASQPWIKLDIKKAANGDGTVNVAINWSKLTASSKGTITITGPNGKAVRVSLSAEKLKADAPAKTFVETDGVVAIDAVHYSEKTDGKIASWQEIDGNGRTKSAMSLFPVTAPSAVSDAELAEAPVLEYRVYLKKAGTVTAKLAVAPSLNFIEGRGLRYAIAFDDKKPQIVDILKDNSRKAWEEAVSANARFPSSTHAITKPGLHILKIRMVDPGVVLQKVVIDAGGEKPSYLGPTESVQTH